MKNMFFENGFLTSTEAQHICNVANELAGNAREYINNITLVDKYISSIVNPEHEIVASLGTDEIAGIPNILNVVCQYNSLCAWLQEAIKYKENLLNSVETPELEKLTPPERPCKPDPITKQYVLFELWDTDKVNKYLSLEASAAVFGKALDREIEGNFASAKKELMDKITIPIEVTGSGQDTIIYKYKPSVDYKEVNNLSLELMKKHRELNASLNKLKSELISTVNKLNTEALNKYNDDLNKFNKEYAEYTTKVRKQSNEVEKYIIKKKEEISALKIAIPKNLMSIYEEVKKH